MLPRDCVLQRKRPQGRSVVARAVFGSGQCLADLMKERCRASEEA